MFAIIENGGKQYKVTKDSLIDLERLKASPGADIILTNVLLLKKDAFIQIGQPYIKGTKVIAEVVRNLRAKKVIAFKYRRRKSSATKKGHRQFLTRVRIKDIKAA